MARQRIPTRLPSACDRRRSAPYASLTRDGDRQGRAATTARALRGPFDYALPERLAGVGVGSVLVVPVRRASALLGVVVELAERSELPAERLAEPLEALEAGRAARAGAARPVGGARVLLDARARPRRWCSRRASVTRARRRGSAPAPWRAHRRRAASAARRTARRLGRRQRAVLEALAAAERELAAVALAAGGADSPLRSLEARGAGVRSSSGEQRARRRAIVGRGRARCAGADAHRAQQRRRSPRSPARSTGPARRAAAPRRDRLGQDRGLPGGGRGGARARARGAIVLVPEIALTPQTVGRFAARFGDARGAPSLRLSAGERHDEWQRLRSGEARVCVGPRSAVFAPVRDLGPDRGRRGARRAPTSRRATRATTRARWPSGARSGRGRARRAAARRRGPRAGPRSSGSSCPSASTAARCHRSRSLDMRGAGRGPAAPADRARRSRGARGTAARRSCCSTAAAGRPSSPAAPAAGSGSARSATSRSSLHRGRARLRCHHCGHSRGACRSPVPTAAR